LLQERIRNEAKRLLRRYPTVADLQSLALLEATQLKSLILTPQFDQEWCESYQLGP